MLIKPECIPCVLNMSVSILRRLHVGEASMRELCTEILDIPSLRGHFWDTTSPEVIEDVMAIINRALNDPDPFASEKIRQNQTVMALYPELREWVKASVNPLETATRLAVLGNAIDFMVPQNTVDIEKAIRSRLEFELDSKEYGAFENRLRASRHVLYFADNCGELVLDRLFMETARELLNIEFTLVVKSTPAMNDATLKEAHATGMDQVATVIENGIQGPLPGTILSRCSKSLRERMQEADLLISKGGGNFDTLDEEKGGLPKPIAFLLLSKCYPYVETFGVMVNHPVLSFRQGPL